MSNTGKQEGGREGGSVVRDLGVLSGSISNKKLNSDQIDHRLAKIPALS